MNKMEIFIKNLFNKMSEKDERKIHFSPTRDWRIILFYSFLSIIIFSSFASYFFYNVNGEDVFDSKFHSNESDNKLIDEKKYESVLKEINEREKIINGLKSIKLEIKDP